MRIETYKCDICGVVRAEANHWLLAGVAEASRGRIWSIRDWNEDVAHESAIHLCGSVCAHKALDKHLARLHTGN